MGPIAMKNRLPYVRIIPSVVAASRPVALRVALRVAFPSIVWFEQKGSIKAHLQLSLNPQAGNGLVRFSGKLILYKNIIFTKHNDNKFK